MRKVDFCVMLFSDPNTRLSLLTREIYGKLSKKFYILLVLLYHPVCGLIYFKGKIILNKGG